MAQYVFFMILSLGLYFTTPMSVSGTSVKKSKKAHRVLKMDGGQDGWGEGGK